MSEVSRRDFLKLAATAGTAAALVEAKRQWENLFGTLTNSDTAAAVAGELAGFTLEQLGTEKGRLVLEAGAKIYAEDSNRIIQEDLREFDRSELIAPNPNLRPINEIVSAGLKLYEEKGGTPTHKPIYSPDPRIPLSDAEEHIKRVIKTDLDSPSGWDYITLLGQEFNEMAFKRGGGRALSAVELSNRPTSFYYRYVRYYPLGGMLKTLGRECGLDPELVMEPVSAEWEEWEEKQPQQVLECFSRAPGYFKSLRQDIREKLLKSSPISASELLAHFLEVNGGNIPDSLWDTAIYLKMDSRTDSDDNDGSWVGAVNEERQRHVVENFSAFILDEYSLNGNYHSLAKVLSGGGGVSIKPEDSNPEVSSVNRIGVAYHGWNAVALLTFASAELVAAATAGRALHSNHGGAKMAADLAAASRLKRVEEILEQYRKP